MAGLVDVVVIRQAMKEDLPSLEWDGEYTHFRRLYAEAYRRSQLGDALLWLAELPQLGLVGQLFVQLRSERGELADGFSKAYVYGFRIRPAYRNQGLGTRLLEVVEADLVRRGFLRVNLNVGQDNPDARRLYERLGYQVVGEDPGRWSYFDEKGQRRDVHEPAWRLTKALHIS